MKNSPDTICEILSLSEKGVKVSDLCKVWDIEKSTFFELKKKFSGMNESQISNVIELENESRKLKRELKKSNKLLEAAQDLISKKL